MGDRILKDILLHNSTLQLLFFAKGFNSSGPLKWFYCALQWRRIGFYGLCVHEPASLTRNYGTHEPPSQMTPGPGRCFGQLEGLLAADLGFKEIHVDARA
jgi:hypothetical protein